MWAVRCQNASVVRRAAPRIQQQHIHAQRLYSQLARPVVCRHVTPSPNITRGSATLNVARSLCSAPPHTIVAMPSLSPTMTEGNLAVWHVKEGDEIGPGTVMADIETDKATMEFESQEDGYVAKILVQAGTRNVPVGMPIMVLVDNAADVAKADLIDTQASSTDAAQTPSPPSPKPSTPKKQESKPASSGKTFPPHQVLAMPALSPTMTHGNLSTWKVEEGAFVEPGTILADIETDKATMEFESQEEGYVARLLISSGSQNVPLGTPVLVLAENEDDIGKFADFTAAAPGSSETATPTPEPKEEATPAASQSPPSPPARGTVTRSGDRIIASPLAKKTAHEKGVNLAGITGSGPGGRIIQSDVLQAGSGAQTTASASAVSHGVARRPVAPLEVDSEGYTDIPHSNIRRIVASKLTEAKQTIPHFYLSTDINMDKLLETRASLNASAADSGVKLSVNDMIIKAAACALKAVPEVNCSFRENEIRQFSHIDISVAMQTPQGLLVPVVRGVGSKGLGDISKTVKELAVKANANKISPDEMAGGTFSISNLGMFGIKNFSAIINPPQACILAVGGTRDEIRPTATGELGVTKVMSVTLSCDHRAVDGVLGSQWLQAFTKYIENPSLMLL